MYPIEQSEEQWKGKQRVENGTNCTQTGWGQTWPEGGGSLETSLETGNKMIMVIRNNNTA